MSKVTITAIKNCIKNGGAITDLGIEVKKYLSINDKLSLVYKIIEMARESSEDLFKINYVYKEFFYEIEMIRAYSNIDFSTIDKLANSDKIEEQEKYGGKLIEFYDLLKEHGIIDYTLNLINTDEKVFIKKCIEEQIQENHIVNNSLGAILSKALDKLIERIPTDEAMKSVAKELVDNLKKINPENLKLLAQVVKFNNPSTSGK